MPDDIWTHVNDSGGNLTGTRPAARRALRRHGETLPHDDEKRACVRHYQFRVGDDEKTKRYREVRRFSRAQRIVVSRFSSGRQPLTGTLLCGPAGIIQTTRRSERGLTESVPGSSEYTVESIPTNISYLSFETVPGQAASTIIRIGSDRTTDRPTSKKIYQLITISSPFYTDLGPARNTFVILYG